MATLKMGMAVLPHVWWKISSNAVATSEIFPSVKKVLVPFAVTKYSSLQSNSVIMDVRLDARTVLLRNLGAASRLLAIPLRATPKSSLRYVEMVNTILRTTKNATMGTLKTVMAVISFAR